MGIHDKLGKELHSGDVIIYYGDEKCIVLWNESYETWDAVIMKSMWYGDNKYDIGSYGKSYQIPMDDGERMNIEIIEGVCNV